LWPCWETVKSEQNACRYVVWDWNGTLLDDMWLCLSVMNRMLRKRGMPAVSAEQYRASFTFPVRDYYVFLGYDFTRESFEDLSVEFIAGYEAGKRECALQPQVQSTLKRIADSGRRQSLLSASAQTSLEEAIGHFQLAPYFERVMGLDNIYAHSKVEQGKQLVASLPFAPQEVLLVGDTLHDLEVAQAMGVSCVLVAHGHQSRTRLQKSGVPVIDSLKELVEFL
jgi:phosphoglycolate phosphatase